MVDHESDRTGAPAPSPAPLPSVELAELLGVQPEAIFAEVGEAIERRDIRPTDAVPLVTNEEPRRLQSWGFLGPWSESAPGYSPLAISTSSRHPSSRRVEGVEELLHHLLLVAEKLDVVEEQHPLDSERETPASCASPARGSDRW